MTEPNQGSSFRECGWRVQQAGGRDSRLLKKDLLELEYRIAISASIDQLLSKWERCDVPRKYYTIKPNKFVWI
jgi:hypothetical protein